MRSRYAIKSTQKAYEKQGALYRRKMNILALQQFEKPVNERLSPEEVFVRSIGRSY